MSSPVTKDLPSGRRPPNAITSNSQPESAGTLSGIASLNALRMHPVIRLIVAVREPTGAGATGFTSDPLGRCSVTGRKQPALVGIVGSVSARTAKYAAAWDPDGTQLNGPLSCAPVPVKSI